MSLDESDFDIKSGQNSHTNHERKLKLSVCVYLKFPQNSFIHTNIQMH